MSNIYFIADTHFSHKKIIEFEDTKKFRPFSSIEEHDEELVKRWNSVVKPKDTVWHLGDVVFGRQNLHIIGRLNGHKHLVMGNHDRYNADEYLKYFATLHGIVEYKGMVLSHVPIHEDSLKRWSFNVHGHLHTNRVQRQIFRAIQIDLRYFCVSCEQINLTPISLDAVLEEKNNGN